MNIRQKIILLILGVLNSCSNIPASNTANTENRKIFNDTPHISNSANSPVSARESEQDTATTINFNDLSVTISRLIIFDEGNKIDKIQSDTVELYTELGETIEGQQITVKGDQLTDVMIEQRYETSVTIMNEGPHCDLTDWKHFYSDWKQLQSIEPGRFICAKYSEKESESFPQISMSELKQKVKEQCGDEWFKLVEKIKTPTEYPAGVGISRYWLKITGKRKDTRQAVMKMIILEIPMGC